MTVRPVTSSRVSPYALIVLPRSHTTPKLTPKNMFNVGFNLYTAHYTYYDWARVSSQNKKDKKNLHRIIHLREHYGELLYMQISSPYFPSMISRYRLACITMHAVTNDIIGKFNIFGCNCLWFELYVYLAP